MVTFDQLSAMKEGGRILAKILTELESIAKVGVTTKEIDSLAGRLCLKYKVKPSFLGYQEYPAAVCVSINEEVVHGIPGIRKLKKGDLVSLDFGVYHKKFHTDSARSFIVGGEATSADKKLIEVTKSVLDLGIKTAKAGYHIGDIGFAIQNEAESQGFNCIRALVGHGIGRKVHEEPMVPNFGTPGQGPIIKKGMSLAIEPMITAGSYEVYQESDGWTYKTVDHSRVAHFEDTVYVTDGEPIILTRG